MPSHRKNAVTQMLNNEAGQIKLALPSQNAPAKPIDDADDGVQGIQQAPLLRNDARAIADRRRIEAELNEERNDVAEVPVFDVQAR